MSTQLETWPSTPLLSSSVQHSSVKISKVYRQASTLFLTRRLPESLSTILPVLNFSPDSTEPPPIYKATKTTRIKVWSLYVTILNAICDLSLDEGKQAFGNIEYRSLVAKVRDGVIWDEVVKNGFAGSEGDVDTDIVINLATLLLAHARNQKINQLRLESYLALRSNPELQRTDGSQSRTYKRSSSLVSSTGGIDNGRELKSLVKVLELYTLHVLLRNDEWEFAREVISASSILDEERRDAFLEALQTLKCEHEILQQRELEERAFYDEKLRCEAEEMKKLHEAAEIKREEEESMKRIKCVDSSIEQNGNRSERNSNTCETKSTPKKSSLHPFVSTNGTPVPKKTTNLSPFCRVQLIIGNISKIIGASARNLKAHSFFTIKLVISIISLLFLLRQRTFQYMIRRSWDKIKSTVTMASGKTSYL
ncbi:putative peroxin 26 [Golovinomyces cichoracearum]|uniref:Putative peroxin 26 n=1 Tax=Golovinomyces cichoracearum TaxID=62708 RepID=A0A420H9R4_9PEZI|nr:putative peroxin 26 [Golovinomyces cichoracearum]